MNSIPLRFLRRVAATVLLATICAFSFAAIRSTTTGAENETAFKTPISSKNKQALNAKSPAIADGSPDVMLRTEKRGYPLLNLQNGKRIQTRFVGEGGVENSLSASQARPQTIINADLNLDGADDLIVGYESGSNGRLAIYQGNPDSLSARTPEIFEGIKEGRFPAPFLSTARLIELSIAPDFIGAGDFNRDGFKDIIAAARGANSLVLLAGNKKGDFQQQTIELPGRIAALLAEKIDPADGQSDVAVALSNEDGAWLFVFDDKHNVFAAQPRIYRLPGEATSLALGQLDDSAPMDILAAAGGKAVVIHGSYAEKNGSLEASVAANARQVEVLNAGTDVKAVRVGNFVWDRANQPEIALLSNSGRIQILHRGRLDTRQYTEEEFEAQLRNQEEQDRKELAGRNAAPANRAEQATAKQKQWRRETAQSWAESDNFALSSGFNLAAESPASVFTSARMTTEGVDNLIITDAASRKIKVLLPNTETLKAAGESYEQSRTGALAAVELDAAASPAAVLPMRLGVMNRPGLVMVDKETAEVSYSLAAPVATYTVNTTADTSDGVCDANCSLRDAIRAANATAGIADIVAIPAGTYTLTIGPSDDSPADASMQQSGDLDIRDDLTITGAGQATTIIQAGTSPANGIDRVLHVRQAGAAVVDLSISGVTIRNGKCSTAGSVANPNGARCNTGGAGLLVAGQDTAVYTITDSTITSNWNVATNAGTGVFFLNGAGIFIGRGDTVLTNATVSNNETGATGSQHGGDGGGLLFGFSSATNINTVVMNNCTVTGNVARRLGGDTLGGNGGGLNQAYDDVDINGGNYSNNTADFDGGAFQLLTATDFTNNVSILNNNAAGSGGGISNTGTVGTLNSATITNNSAAQVGGGIFNTGTINIDTPTLNNNSAETGGGIYSAKGILSITNGTVSNNTATSGKGGGIEHRGSSASSISFVIISNNTGSGIHISGSGSLDATNNTITGNTADGISKIGNGTGSHFNSNTIHSNGELGIDLSDDGVTANDANDADTGPNNLQNFPVINYVRRTDGVANVTLNAANGSYRVQYYANTACDASGHGEGELLLPSQNVTITTGDTLTFNSPALNFGNREQITAIATHDVNNNGNFDDDGDTSEFSACRKVNTAPTITAQATNRQQGSSSSNSTVASVTDPDQPLNTLSVTVNGGASATVNGVTVSNLAVDASGNVTANVAADCTATNASFTLRVADNVTDFNETTLNVVVNPNTAPTLGNYSNITVNAGSSGTVVTPDAAPADNGSIQSITASAAPAGFTGAFGVNTTTGAVTINNAASAGTYTITVTATDNCGSVTTKQFTLTVNAIATITAANVSRQQGSPASNSQIATVSDTDQAEETLVVTINNASSATVNGVTVSNIAVNAAGVVTADAVASCTATNAGFTLRVTESNGAFNEATLNVAVAANTAPTVGNYPNASLTPGSGTTVTPSAAPAENGSIVSATAAAPGFTGTLSVNPTTGDVSVSNAGPYGNYTVTVTFTDNCGATTTRQFNLEVVDETPPDTTITNSPSNPSNSSNAAFTFTGTDSGGSGVASFECKLDAGNFVACTSPQTYAGLSDGSHTFQVRAKDAAGNADPSPASFTWTIDTIAPSVTINQAANQPDPAVGNSAVIHFTVVFSEPVSGFTNSDVTISGTAGATTVVVTQIAPNDGTTYDVAVSGMTQAGTVIASIPAGAAQDAATNGNTASTSTDNTVTYTPNRPPTASPDAYSTNEDTPLVVAAPGVLGNDGDPDPGNTITAVLVSGPSNAQSFTLNADGSFNYTPAANFNGSVSFSYKARDNNNADSSVVSVTIAVAAVNDAPSFASGGNVTVAEDSGAYSATWATAISKGPADENGQAAAFMITNNTNSALFSSAPTIAPNGTLSFTTAPNAFGSAVITVVLKDNGGTANGGVDTSAPVSFTINVTPVNDPPTVSVGAGGSCGGSNGTLNLIINDVDTPAGSITLSGSSSNTAVVPNSNVVFGGSGANRTVTIGAVLRNSIQSSVITITVNDGQGGTTTSTINVIAGSNQTETINGTSGADLISGGNGEDTINAGAGNDMVCGGNGNDTIIGGTGDDTLNGENGDDIIRGEDGNDTLLGDEGDDTLTGGSGGDFFNGGSGNDTLTDFNPGEGDVTNNTLALLNRVLEAGGNWAEE
ncbi:MAG TPA: Ig-like domain-containing protein [Pyrinomonadaceae bacterium]|jgi:CSLREA domain-containing protein